MIMAFKHGFFARSVDLLVGLLLHGTQDPFKLNKQLYQAY